MSTSHRVMDESMSHELKCLIWGKKNTDNSNPNFNPNPKSTLPLILTLTTILPLALILTLILNCWLTRTLTNLFCSYFSFFNQLNSKMAGGNLPEFHFQCNAVVFLFKINFITIFTFSFSDGIDISGSHNLFLARYLHRHSNLQIFGTTSKLLAWETKVQMFT